MRHALVTAGTKGLGRKVTEKLLGAGCTVTIHYRSDQGAAVELERDLSDYEGRFDFVQGDLLSKDDLNRMTLQTLERWGKVDILVLNAGPYIFERKKLIDYTEDEWHAMIGGNLTSAFYLLKDIVPHMREQRFGRIITYGFQGSEHAPGWLYRSAFAAAKTGLVSLTKTLSIEEAEYGITANMVCPGEITGAMKEASIEESRKHPDPRTPVGRSGTGEDIARTVLFLADDHSDMITGTVIEVTGGIDVLHKHRKPDE
ncbi:SDR family oxidoreductase [Alteribacter natronophilus]|uniref:SDR family oxidoreductase n=1 Tax=Alteribacter natronophilus TaxID=2583810 RepID=UPI00110F0195|nr:SDR family oxidoreductase [Alteribacter natronophilus]TMW71720.1 SDR family oxidoreductase [Alteribacter natronophilus]